ncbi:Os02g0829000 [Oryza sativa Japonica Group]|uniref:Os02g0829000 protein n=1 Tax=Oryza sativa subsp. japonica TaxID=39947 RepID=A0A0P0VRL1_ORYSJ|nr:hypothetical protein EE612_014632 [Oryza sativa]KAF2947792.1 hypothetical protein DAI22_02g394100 [Oryza sativa Japonica Group]BAS81723.1 Os02g0829000 [Oryza sativa Japonica Group]
MLLDRYCLSVLSSSIDQVYIWISESLQMPTRPLSNSSMDMIIVMSIDVQCHSLLGARSKPPVHIISYEIDLKLKQFR